MLKPSILSIIGFHGGGSPESILQRKMDDIAKMGLTYWLHRSYKARPKDVQGIGGYCFFIAGSGATKSKILGTTRNTTTDEKAKEWSIDKNIWVPFDMEQSKVSGKVKDGMGHALVLDNIELVEETIDLWDFEEQSGMPLRFYPNACSICCKSAETKQSSPKSHMRKVVAIGRLCEPFAVWVR